MAPIVVPQAALVTCKGSNLGQPWANVLGLNLGANVFTDQAWAQEIATVMKDMYENLMGLLNPSWTLTEILVADIQTATSPTYETAVTPVVGTASGDPLPSNFAVVASHSTGLRGRSYRGRTYLCGFTETSNDTTGKVVSGTQSTIIAAFAQMRIDLASVGAGGHEQAVVSRVLEVATPVVNTTVDPHWDHQDRRKS